jgi:putative oxidoreductase
VGEATTEGSRSPERQPSSIEKEGVIMFSAFARNVLNPLLLRLMLAAIFVFHGLQLVSGEGNQMGAAWARGGDQPAMVQLLVAWGELIGGAALAAGFLTRVAATGIVVIMAGAIYTVHWPNGFSLQNHGYEYNLTIIVMCVCLILGGPGPLAVDRVFRVRPKAP